MAVFAESLEARCQVENEDVVAGRTADRRCSNYIWVIDSFIAYEGASYIRDFTVWWFNNWLALIASSATHCCDNTKLSLYDHWWRPQMETFSALLAHCEGNPPVIPFTKASDAELWCFLWSAPEQTADQTIGTPVILDAIALITTYVTVMYNEIFRVSTSKALLSVMRN